MFVWVMFDARLRRDPARVDHFGNSYLNFELVDVPAPARPVGANLPPFDITRDKFVDAVAACIYVVVLGLNVVPVRGVAEAQGRGARGRGRREPARHRGTICSPASAAPSAPSRLRPPSDHDDEP